MQKIFIVGNTDKTFPTFSMHDSQIKYTVSMCPLLGAEQYLITLLFIMFGTLTYHGMLANYWKDVTHSGILTRCLPPSQEGEAHATGHNTTTRAARLRARSEVNTPPTIDHATSTSKPCRRHLMTSPWQPPSTPYPICFSKENSHSCTMEVSKRMS